MSNGYTLMPEDFEDHNFALNNSQLFDEFIDKCIRGYQELEAMRLVFGEETVDDGKFISRLYALKRNPYYKAHYEKRLAEIPLNELWNPRIAVQQLVQIARSSEKDSARINAIKELNVVTGITVIDEAGNTKMGRSLDDFYAQVEQKMGGELYADQQATKH